MWFVTNGDILMRCLHDISCFLAVVRFPYEISCLLIFVLNTVVSKQSGVGVGGERVSFDGKYLLARGRVVDFLPFAAFLIICPYEILCVV
jgi:hypothetical protein